MANTTIAQAKTTFLESIKLTRSNSTVLAYSMALESFSNMLESQKIDTQKFPVVKLTENYVTHFVTYMKDFSPSTESLYLQVIKSFYEYIDSEHLAKINISHVRMLMRQRSRRSSHRSVQFPESDINRLLDFISNLANLSTQGVNDLENQKLRDMRDRAFILTLADTGLRVNEICKLRRGDIGWDDRRAILTGRGNKRAFVRFSTRAMDALMGYLSLRASLDEKTGRPLSSLPLFARHDKGAGKKIKPITTTTSRSIVADSVRQILGEEAVGRITPHSFLHYFVTTILRATGNLKLAQELARHKDIQVTQRYAHLSDDELDKGYYEIFEKKD